MQQEETPVLSQTGQQLIDLCRLGDPQAFHALFNQYKDRVYTIALRYTNDPAAAQDVAQEVFVKLYAAIQTYRAESTFESWLYRLTANACFDRNRKSRRLLPMLEGFLHALRAPAESQLETMLKAEQSEQIQTAVESLPPDQRIAIVLRYSQALSYEQIAEVLECSTGTVASRLSRAHKLLEKRLRRKHV